MASKQEEPAPAAAPAGRYKTGILVDLNSTCELGSDAGKAVRDTASGWFSSLLESVESWVVGAGGGVTLGPYVVEEPEHVYGEGGYGRVLRGKDTRSGETVAIKELSASSERRHSALAHFSSRARTGPRGCALAEGPSWMGP